MNTGSGWKWQLEDSSYATNQTITIGDATYRFNAAGMMVTGWDLQDGKWSYYNAYGARVSGLVKDGSWYYLKASGAMATGWVKVGDSWYYLSYSGAMLTGTHTINGRTYVFDENGAWVG